MQSWRQMQRWVSGDAVLCDSTNQTRQRRTDQLLYLHLIL
eukprot:SAG31_NODE_24560_length_479_cov_0.536842_1_plen_39_part_01